MPIPYLPKVNQRSLGNEQLIVNEEHLIGKTSLTADTLATIRLHEVPLFEVPSTVIIPGYTEITAGVPSPTEFIVDYTNGRILFDSSLDYHFSPTTVFVTYKGRGSEVDAEDVNDIQAPLSVALNLDGTLSPGIVKPNNISTVVTDNFLFPNNVTVTGDLTVNGTTTTINTQNLNVEDNIITLNYGFMGVPTMDSGIEIIRGSSPTVRALWVETTDNWEFRNSADAAILKAFDTGDVSVPAGDLSVSGDVSSTTLTASSDATISGMVITDTLKSRTLDLTIKPNADSTTAIKLTDSLGTTVVAVDTSNGRVGVNTTPDAAWHNAGDTIYGLVSLVDPLSITTEVNEYSGAVITTTGSVNLTLPAPTSTTAGRLFFIAHHEGSTGSLTVDGVAIGPGFGVSFGWSGTAWIPMNTDVGFIPFGTIRGSTSNVGTQREILQGTISTPDLRDSAVTPLKLDATVAGAGLSGGAGSPLDVNVDGSTIEINSDILRVKAGGITETQLNSSVSGAGLTGGAGFPLAVNVDNSTIEINSDTVRVKDGGITPAKLTGIIPVVNGGTNSGTALTGNKAVVTNATQIVEHSTTTSTEVGYLSGVTGPIQTQLNSLSSINPVSNGGFEIWSFGASHVGASGAQVTDGWFIATGSGGGSTDVFRTNSGDVIPGADTGEHGIYTSFGSPGTETVDVVQDIANYAEYRGKTITLSVRVKPYQLFSPAYAQIFIADGVSGATSTSITSSSASFQTLSVTYTVASTASMLRIGLRCANSMSGISLVIWDSVAIGLGSSVPVYNPAILTKIGSVEGSTANISGIERQIVPGTISTPDIRNNAVSQVLDSSGSTGVSPTGTTLASIVITTTGGPVVLMGNGSFTNVAASAHNTVLVIYRVGASSVIPGGIGYAALPSATIGNIAIGGIDTPAAGTYTYRLGALFTNSQLYIPNAFGFTAFELKK